MLILVKEKIPYKEGSFPDLNPKKRFENKYFSGSSKLGFLYTFSCFSGIFTYGLLFFSFFFVKPLSCVERDRNDLKQRIRL
ncbi:hypothetical protein MSLAZ_1376 [Methanosarcina lacustris Z-7289]|uniref:Uncharacterized protein n=1 Tax=Methanosarcina lacustris Z-7289 TaxID=1434111 RepID=A0A0E3S5X0_9EURY|nr:hypothetical protein MSLAZ_1376 [Methanosarcina lacustris Z-7289]